MFVNAASFPVVALAGLALEARRRAERAELGKPDRLRDGVVFLFRERTLALVLIVVLVSLLFMSASVSAEVFFVKRNRLRVHLRLLDRRDDTRLARRGSAAPRTGEAGRRSLPAEACGEPRSVPGVSRSTNGPWVLTTWRAK